MVIRSSNLECNTDYIQTLLGPVAFLENTLATEVSSGARNSQIYLLDHNMTVSFEQVVLVGTFRMEGETGVKLEQYAAVCYNTSDLCQQQPLVQPDLSDTCSNTHSKGGHLHYLESNLESILTLVCGVVSLAGLLITLCVYLVCPALLTFPGKALVNLLVSLFMAQLAFLCSNTLLGHSAGCVAIAAVQHYLWLVSFGWMNSMAFCMYKTFNSQISVNHSKGSWKLMKYCAYSWGVPLMIVSCCLSLHQSGFAIYGSTLSCWFSKPLPLALTFSLPILLVLIVNFFCFIHVLWTLRHDLKRVPYSTTTLNRCQRLRLYVKISSVMGLSWVLGFLSNIQALSFLRFAFIISTGLHGLIISLSFTQNAHVRFLLRSKLHRIFNLSSFAMSESPINASGATDKHKDLEKI